MWNTFLIIIAVGALLLACNQAPAPTATQGPTPTNPVSGYSMSQIVRWEAALADQGFQIPGVTVYGLDERAGRIKINMAPRRGAREKFEDQLSTLDVPRDAFAVNVGCSAASQRGGYLTEVVDEAFRGAVAFSVETASRVSYGETLALKLTLRNLGDEILHFYRGGRPSHDFVVSSSGDTEVWHWLCAKFIALPLGRETLEPGESLELSGEWEQVDNRGNPVPAGEYLVRGVLFLEPPERLVTAPLRVEVLPAPDTR